LPVEVSATALSVGAGHDGGVDWELASAWELEFDRLTRRVYAGVRRRAVDREAAFDLACQVLEVEPLDEAAAELALACAEEPDEAKLAAAALRVLDERFTPGFEDEPGWLAALEAALEVVNADMRATGLPGTGRLVVPDAPYPPNAFVEVWDGWRDSDEGIYPPCGRDPVLALVEVADDAQGAVMHSINGAWPVCPAHSLGVHAEEREGTAVWWCRGGGHVVALIGRWSDDDGAH
jgi:hypothetical protein